MDRILELIAGLENDEQVSTQLRRELHALKGASRMMGFREVANACHLAEDQLEGPAPAQRSELLTIGDQLRSLVESLEHVGKEPTMGTDIATELESSASERPHRGREELRVASGIVDDLADRGARLRVVSVAAEGLADRIFRLAALAERGVGERDPRQVLATLAISLRQVAMEFESGQRIFRRLSDRQLEALLRLQVQPLKPFLTNLSGHARELADTLGKTVKVQVRAGDAQLDRRIINVLREAFLHLVRNAVDHGIESPKERKRMGKKEVGSIRIEAEDEGDRVRIRVVDDGRGIDIDAVVKTAIDRQIVNPEAAPAIEPAEALQLLLRPGFTTREETSELSGRGIGLDAVAATVRSAGGDLWIESTVGEGTEVNVEVPVARRGDRVLVLGIGPHQVAVPASPVRAYRSIAPEMVEIEGDRFVLRVRGRVVDARFLSELVGERPSETGVMVEMIVGGSPVALVADTILGEEEVIVRPLLRSAGAPVAMEGITLLSSGRPVPVLSLQRLVPFSEDIVAGDTRLAASSSPIHVLLVDDSRVTREMMRRLLEDAGFKVTGVGSADDALLALAREHVNCLVTDIEMPGVDGLDLTRRLRSETEHADLPIVVVSTLDRPSDRLAGLDSGADAYLTKQGLDVRELVALISRVGGGGQ
ncbi:MAG: response regulator [Acidobacteria bacterium]|uniref:histidine kinase n=1 Tax=Candidatus Sulfomarinibacter kjeldsenii TaxID=2885994 RepID=A0A8J6XZS7_9BACT|nr:response regulator [Candidatus Sulfomarinibacter kjeldsenii]